MEIKDQLNRVLNFNTTPKRIVSLVPCQTELLFDLGLENKIVGITKSCIHPYHLKHTKTIVGGADTIDFDSVKDLKPDAIVCSTETSGEIIEQCVKIAPVHISNVTSIDDTLELINQYGKMFSCRTEASKITQKIEFNLNDFNSFIKNKEPKKVAYFIWRDPWKVAGSKTFTNHLLALNKFENIYANKYKYSEIEIKKMRLEGDPNLVFLPAEPYPFKEEHAFELGRFTHHATTVFVDGKFFSWYGSSLVKAFDYFKNLHQRISN